MGRVLRGAAVAPESYVVAVPAPASDTEAEGFELGSDSELPAPEIPAGIDVERVRAGAKALIDEAEARSEAMLREAAGHARELVEAAAQQADAIGVRARAGGHAEGFAAGEAEARAQAAEALATMRELVESVRAQRHALLESAEPEIVRLAVAVAERITHQHIALAPDVILETVRSALTRLVSREVVTLRVNPADLETIRQYRDAIAAPAEIEHLRVIEDQRVDRGGAIVETESGTIDAKIATQLRETRRVLQVADAVAQAS